jgi:IS5 family transposase
MRRNFNSQMPLAPRGADHKIADEFQVISKILDENPIIYELAKKDLCRGKRTDTGKNGMTGEQAVRAAIVQRICGLSYRDLAFHLKDSKTFHKFSRLAFDSKISFKTLCENIKKLRPQTWEAIHRVIVSAAKAKKIDDFSKVRYDSTAVQTNIHHPTDSTLLCDCVRVITRLVKRAAREHLRGRRVPIHSHNRATRRLALKIAHEKNQDRRRGHYRRLIRYADKALGYGCAAAMMLKLAPPENPLASIEAKALAEKIDHYCDLAMRVIDQAARRVIKGEKLAPDQKIVSIFEEHTDIIVKDRRETLFGHKVFLSSGKSGIINDCVIARGNPADSGLYPTMLKRHVEQFKKAPRQTAADGGFASVDNLLDAKDANVIDAVFNKKRGLAVGQMARSVWIYKSLKRFRAGIEAVISWCARKFGWHRCDWKGWDSFQSYLWTGIIARNLVIMARKILKC